jgi:hypothetical protein
MTIMTTRRLVLNTLLPFCCLTGAAHAGNSLAGTAHAVHYMGNGAVLFSHSGTRSGVPACATISTRFAINGATAAGKVQVAGLLSAVARGKTLNIIGNGDCSVWSDSETVHYIVEVD